MVAELARRAGAAAVDASPHKAPADRWQRSLTLGLPAARWLLHREVEGDADGLSAGFDQLAEAASRLAGGEVPRLTDGFGHHRAIYHWLLWHLHLRVLGQRATSLPEAVRQRGRNAADAAMPVLRKTLFEQASGAIDAPQKVWAGLCQIEYQALTKGIDQAQRDEALIAEALSDPGDEGALRAQGFDEPIDDWTYRELVTLHALHHIATLTGDAAWQHRVEQAARFHQDHTQPDYTTYQPWALAAFAEDSATGLFAEQQLHDVTVHLQTGGPAAALVPALLLADAAAVLQSE
jgi:hypothetical protein